MSFFVWLLLSVAWAGPPQDLGQASDPDLPEEARMAAFDRLVTAGMSDIGVLSRVATDNEADSRKRWVAIRALGKIRGDQAKSLLVGLTDNPEPAIRAAAVQALGDFGDATLANLLTQKLTDPAIIVRAGAAEALCKVGDRNAVEPLAAALRSKDNYYRGSSLWVRSHYVAALGCIGSRSAIPTLLQMLDDKDPNVVASAVLAFREVAGFTYGEGRSPEEEIAAWKRWAADQLR